MADSEEECDTWRNRDKYPKEREPSEKKASPSPIDQKNEKRSFNTFSPNKSVEPPFKRQKSNFDEDSGYNKNGPMNNNNNNRRDNFDNRKDGFDNRKDGFDNRKDGFDNRKNNFDNRKNNFDNRKDSFDNRRDNFDDRRGGGGGGGFDNRRDSFDNRKDSFDNRKDSFDNRKDSFDNRKDNFDNNKRDNFDNNKRDNFDNNNKRDNFENRSSIGVVNRQVEEMPNYPTQPQMLLFKHFLQQQEDDIEMESAMAKYNEYKDTFVKKQLKAFFEAHNSQEWFREKYLPSFLCKNREKEARNILLRKEIFMFLLDHQWMDTIKLHIDESDSIVRLMDAVVILLEGGNEHDLKILDSRRYRSESPNDCRVVPEAAAKTGETAVEGEESVEVETEAAVAKETMEVQKEGEVAEAVEKGTEEKEARALHKTFSIFLRNLHPNVLRSEIEALVKPYPGFLRLALQDPTPDRKFFRRGWVTYDRTVNIKEICWNLNNVRLHDCDIGAIVNRELTQRVRPVNVLTNHRPVMRQDIRVAAKLVAKFDRRRRLWCDAESGGDSLGVVKGDSTNPMASGNPLLRDITEFLVDEGSYEEEALLGGNLNCQLELLGSACAVGSGDTAASASANISIETDEKARFVLDRLIFYLRFVHSYDYYSNTEYQIEDEMPHRCGIIHARGAHIYPDRPLSLKDVEDYIKAVETKAETILSAGDTLSEEEAKKLGVRSLEEVVESFIEANTQEIAKDKWLCPLSGKKFKGPDFVRKHVLNKHMERVEEARQMAEFFNNYLLDVKRPQLPEHPVNRAGGAPKAEGLGEGFPGADGTGQSSSRGGGGDNSNRGGRGGGDVFRGGSSGRRGEDYGDRRSNYRGSSPSNDFGGRGGNNGSYYRKNSFSSRGGSGGGSGGGQYRQRNGGGSYYSRSMMSYNDLDAPMDD